MEHFAVEGQWWLPDEPDRRVPGTLTFNVDGLELVLYGTFGPSDTPIQRLLGVDSPKREVEAVILGMTRQGRPFTLLEALAAGRRGSLQHIEESYWAEMALDGCHTRCDRFAEVWCGFDYLDAWADPPSLRVDDDDRDSVRARVDWRDLAQAELGDASLRLVSGAEGQSGSDRIDLTRSTYFVLTVSEAQSARILVESYVRPLQDLLMFCVGRSVRLTSLQLRATDVPDTRERPAAASFNAIQPSESRTRTLADLVRHSAPTILRLGDTPVNTSELLCRWFTLWESWREVFTLLHAPLYAPFMYGQHAFSATFQSAEALHDLVLETRDVSKADHKNRVQAVIEVLQTANLDASVVDWASNVLRGRNDKKLADKIEDLVKSTGAVGEAVLAAEPAFASTSASARSHVSHPGETEALEPEAQYWYTQALRWVVRTRVLMNLLDDAENAQRRVVQRPSFQRCLKALVPT